MIHVLSQHLLVLSMLWSGFLQFQSLVISSEAEFDNSLGEVHPNVRIEVKIKSNTEWQHLIWVSWQLADAQLSFIETEQT